MDINRGIVLMEMEQESKSGGRIFQIKETTNTIEYYLTACLNEDEVNYLIDLGIEVRIVSEWLP